MILPYMIYIHFTALRPNIEINTACVLINGILKIYSLMKRAPLKMENKTRMLRQ